MRYQQGRALIKGDKIGLTAPAGPVKSEQLQQAIFAVEELGFKVEVGMTCHEEYGGYLAGPPKQRAHELNWMFANPEIKAIFCLRGGYGSPQLLHLLDYELIARHPKMFVGYSDITALHIAIQQKSNLATIHGPMPASDLILADDFTKTSLLKILMGDQPLGLINNPNNEEIHSLIPGFATGVLTGGNLSLVTSLLGTPFEIDTKGKLLFLEEIGEEPYKIDRMLTQLALAGKLADAEGIVLGTWIDCESEKYEDGFQVKDLFEKIIAPFGKPTIFNVRAGHCKPALTLPFGVLASIYTEEKRSVIDLKI
ncbi:S66 peptidase family protein [Lederbergia citrea]|uniref:S66 peptidase family protein n=1 Tax=Lederbergia citrea TaxID=2833581 RepID=UPI001BC9CECD|nr:LD-carboxypeptidase [Lederbergia citrea]MBS4177945.1 LD-carboxypeptidase [Lederbergia citrea]